MWALACGRFFVAEFSPAGRKIGNNKMVATSMWDLACGSKVAYYSLLPNFRPQGENRQQ
jgi:hypothetical protein